MLFPLESFKVRVKTVEPGTEIAVWAAVKVVFIKDTGIVTKLAVQDLADVIVTVVMTLVPVQSPDQEES